MSSQNDTHAPCEASHHQATATDAPNTARALGETDDRPTPITDIPSVAGTLGFAPSSHLDPRRAPAFATPASFTLPSPGPLLTRRSALALLGAAGLTLLTGCTPDRPEVVQQEVYISPYDWAGLASDGQRLEYWEDGALVSHWGIDVSEHQRTIDWRQVAQAGVEFAFLRIGNRGATAGTLNIDEQFESNCRGARLMAVPVSGYFFSQAITPDEAAEEAAFALEQVRTAEASGSAFQAIAYDHEAVHVDGARANDLTDEQLSENAAAFCAVVAAAGYEPLIYGNQRDLRRISYEVRTTYPVWLAEYDVAAPTAPLDFTIWQYSNAGSIPGISTAVDLNLWLPTKRGQEIELASAATIPWPPR